MGNERRTPTQIDPAWAQQPEVSARAGHANPAITLRVYAHRIKGAEERMLKEYEEQLDLKGTEATE